MPAIIKEQNMFEDTSTLCWGIPVNTKGVMGNGLALYFKQQFPYIESFYKRACKDGSLLKEKYLQIRIDIRDFFFIITKHDWKDDSKYEYILDSLLTIDKDFPYKDTGEFGHTSDTIYLPALGCGKGNLKWEEIEDRLIDDLKDTKVNFVFCIESYRRPNKFYEVFERQAYFFKGDCLLGITGDYPFKLLDKTYKNAGDFILQELSSGLEDKGSFKETVSHYIRTNGRKWPNGKHMNDIVLESLYLAKKEQYDQYPEFKTELERIKGNYPVYCGNEFGYVIGCGETLDNRDRLNDDVNEWVGHNRLGDILQSLY